MQDSDAIKLFVGQIPKHMEEEDLRPVFEEFGEIFDLAVIRDKISGLHRGEKTLLMCCVADRLQGEQGALGVRGEVRAFISPTLALHAEKTICKKSKRL